jgi:hypothetical protein
VHCPMCVIWHKSFCFLFLWYQEQHYCTCSCAQLKIEWTDISVLDLGFSSEAWNNAPMGEFTFLYAVTFLKLRWQTATLLQGQPRLTYKNLARQ